MNASLLDRALYAVLVILSGLMVATVAFQVVARYVFDAPPVWTSEFSTLTLVCLTFLGSALVVQRRQGFRITTLSDRFEGTSVGRMITGVVHWFEVGFVVLIVVYSVQLLVSLWVQNLVALDISAGWMVLPIPVGFAAMAVALVRSGRRDADPVTRVPEQGKAR